MGKILYEVRKNYTHLIPIEYQEILEIPYGYRLKKNGCWFMVMKSRGFSRFFNDEKKANMYLIKFIEKQIFNKLESIEKKKVIINDIKKKWKQ